MRVLGFHHLAIQARSLELTTAFYRDVLGLLEQARHLRADGTLRAVWLALPGDAFLALEEVGGAPEQAPFASDRPGLHLLALRIAREDRAEVLVRLAARGIEVERQTRWTVFFRDPEGNRVALSHHPADPVAR